MREISPLDHLFYELYGFYPNKSGQAYEMLVAAAFKIISGQELRYDQHLRGDYSETDYQIDGLNVDQQKVIEAKDYSIVNRKVGRPDIQKLQGALSDLNVKGGQFVSATDYTKPAKKYAESSAGNPGQKRIELYHVRRSTDWDEEGRIKTFVLTITMVVPDYSNGKFDCALTKEAIKKLEQNGLLNMQGNMGLDRFYTKSGEIDCLLVDFTRDNQPILVRIEDDISEGCWLLPDRYVKYQGELYGIKGIQYRIPYNRSSYTFKIESEGKPKVLIKSEDGTINKLLTDKQFRDLTLDKGEVK